MRKQIQTIKGALSGAAAAALSQIKQDLKSEIGTDELEAMGSGAEENEEGRICLQRMV